MNASKCEEVIINFQKQMTDIPPLCIEEQPMARVISFKILGLWMNDVLNWQWQIEKYICIHCAVI